MTPLATTLPPKHSAPPRLDQFCGNCFLFGKHWSADCTSAAKTCAVDFREQRRLQQEMARLKGQSHHGKNFANAPKHSTLHHRAPNLDNQPPILNPQTSINNTIPSTINPETPTINPPPSILKFQP